MRFDHLKLPYESPIETAIGMGILDLIDDRCEAILQHPVRAEGMNFRVDFFFVAGPHHVVIEADGRDFHDFIQDRKRDIAIIKSGAASQILRFKGGDIHAEIGQCISFVERVFPFLFDVEAEQPDFEAHALIRAEMDAMQIQPVLRLRVGDSVGEMRSRNWNWQHRRIYRRAPMV